MVQRPNGQVSLQFSDWVRLIALIYMPVVLAIGWAISINTAIAVTQTQISALSEKIDKTDAGSRDLEKRVRDVERHNP